MKPGDHPDFFRLPAPPGRSRESRIVLDRHGQFWNDGAKVEHEGIARAFASWLAHHPDDGRFILTNGYDWTYLTVEGAPCFVKHVEITNGGATVRLFDGSEEPLNLAAVEVSPGGVLFTRVRGGTLDAEFVPAAQAQMVDLIAEGPDGAPRIEHAGRSHPIRLRPPP